MSGGRLSASLQQYPPIIRLILLKCFIIKYNTLFFTNFALQKENNKKFNKWQKKNITPD